MRAVQDYTNIRVTRETRDKLAELSNQIGKPMTETLSILAHADLAIILNCTAERARRQEAMKLILQSAEKGAREAKARTFVKSLYLATRFETKAQAQAALDEVGETVYGRTVAKKMVGADKRNRPIAIVELDDERRFFLEQDAAAS